MTSVLGQKIRTLRQEKELTLEQLATETGSSKGYMWELENKPAARPSAEKIAKIAKVLGVTLEYLMSEQNLPPTASELDEAFFHRYQTLDTETKEKLTRILDVLDKE